MGEKGRVSRRGLLVGGAATAAGSVAGQAAAHRGHARQGEEPPAQVTATSLGHVVSVHEGALEVAVEAKSRELDPADSAVSAGQFGPGVWAQPAAGTIRVEAPGVEGFWKEGHLAVLIERYVDGEWRIDAVQHLYVPHITEREVVSREGDRLVTDEGDLKVTPGTTPGWRGWPGKPASPDEIRRGDLIDGIGYLAPNGKDVELSRVSVKRAS